MACVRKGKILEVLRDGGEVIENYLIDHRDLVDKNGQYVGWVRSDTLWRMWRDDAIIRTEGAGKQKYMRYFRTPTRRDA
jgi:hypothetical protein